MNNLVIKPLTQKNFSKYGRILFPTKEDVVIVHNSSMTCLVLEKIISNGYLMSYYSLKRRSTNSMENHPNTKEAFEPICGASIIVVAYGPKPEKLEAFVLDKPIVVYESVWHTIITLSQIVTMRIIENTEVQSIRQKLPYTIKAELCIKEG